jgi:hypothetical protein
MCSFCVANLAISRFAFISSFEAQQSASAAEEKKESFVHVRRLYGFHSHV